MKRVNLLTEGYKIKAEARRFKKIAAITGAAIFLYTLLSVVIIFKTIDTLEGSLGFYKNIRESENYQKASETYVELQEKQQLREGLLKTEEEGVLKSINVNGLFAEILPGSNFKLVGVSYAEDESKIVLQGFFSDDIKFNQYIDYLNSIDIFKEIKIIDIVYTEDINASVELYIKDGAGNA
ncbi:MAG: hypothetical protein LBV08_11355 [Clostridiales bacterium]|jgi:hypothetical protein|nr:hypothetical protein [Clostridiales bacterium]